MPDQDADRSDAHRAASPSPPDRTPDRIPGSTPEPRFELGELVMVRSAIDPSRNVDCTRVIDRQWYEGHADWGWYAGWQYIVARHVDAWAVESSLRPRPESGALGWSALKRTIGVAPGDVPGPGPDREPRREPGRRKRVLPVRAAGGPGSPTARSSRVAPVD